MKEVLREVLLASEGEPETERTRDVLAFGEGGSGTDGGMTDRVATRMVSANFLRTTYVTYKDQSFCPASILPRDERVALFGF